VTSSEYRRRGDIIIQEGKVTSSEYRRRGDIIRVQEGEVTSSEYRKDIYVYYK